MTCKFFVALPHIHKYLGFHLIKDNLRQFYSNADNYPGPKILLPVLKLKTGKSTHNPSLKFPYHSYQV